MRRGARSAKRALGVAAALSAFAGTGFGGPRPRPSPALAAPGPFRDRARRVSLDVRATNAPGAPAVPADLYCPEPSRRGPVVSVVPFVVIISDEGRTKEHAAGLAMHLASHGFAVLTPTLAGAGAAARAPLLEAALDAVARRSGPPEEPPVACLLHQELGPALFVAEGRGAAVVPRIAPPGGGRARLGANGVFVAPVPGADPPEGEYASNDVEAPQSLALRVGPGACGDGGGAFVTALASKARITVAAPPGAGPCDGLAPPDPACVARCGGGAAGAAGRMRLAITAWLVWLAGHAPERVDEPRPLDVLAGLAVESLSPAPEPKPQVQFNLSGLAGLGVDARPRAPGREGFAIGFRPEFVFGRRSDAYLGLGPYAEALGTGIGKVQVGAGLTAVVPLRGTLVLAPSAGAFGAPGDGGFQPGWSASAFLGVRHFNAISSFDGSYGLRADARVGLGPRAERIVVIAAQLDLTSLAAVVAWL
jgi:hypothetical protein